MQRRVDGTRPRRLGIVQQVDEAVPVADDVEDRAHHGARQVGVDQRHAQAGAAESDRKVDRRQRLPIAWPCARDENRPREAIAVPASV